MTFALATLLLLAGPPSSADLEFRRSVEEWVMQAAPMATIPEPYRHLIGDLGNDCYQYREASSARLAQQLGAQDRWLFWGRKSRDLEVALRCNQLLIRRFRCRNCAGFGQCTDFDEMEVNRNGWPDRVCRRCGRGEFVHSPDYRQACEACEGTGSAWKRGFLE